MEQELGDVEDGTRGDAGNAESPKSPPGIGIGGSHYRLHPCHRAPTNIGQSDNNQSFEGGFRHLHAQGIRSKHIEYLVGRWHAEQSAPAPSRIARECCAGWLATIDKHNIVVRDNAQYGIADGKYLRNVSKGQKLDATSWPGSRSRTRPCRCGCKRRSVCDARKASSCARPGRTGAMARAGTGTGANYCGLPRAAVVRRFSVVPLIGITSAPSRNLSR